MLSGDPSLPTSFDRHDSFPARSIPRAPTPTHEAPSVAPRGIWTLLRWAGVIFVDHPRHDRLALRTGVLMGLGSPPRMSVQKIAQYPKPTRRIAFLAEREFVHLVDQPFPSLSIPLT